MRTFAILLAAIGALPALLTTPAEAQGARTFVASFGSDLNNNTCSRTSPCATFLHALSQTNAGGEINCLGAGDYGPVTIGFAVTISCEAGTAGITQTTGDAIFIDAADTDDITLHGLDINGVGTAHVGIAVVHARTVHIENCAIRGFRAVSNSAAIATGSLANTNFIYVTDSVLSGNSNGVELFSGGGYKVVSLNNVTITGSAGDGVLAVNGGVFVNITKSVISGNGGNAVRVAAGGSEVNIDRSTLANNATALLASASGATIRTIGNNIYNNTYAFGIAGGATIATDGQNRTGGNVFAQDVNGSVTLK